MIHRQLILLGLFVSLLMILVLGVDEAPPSLTGYQQFYGEVNNMPATGIYRLKAQLSGSTVTYQTDIVNGQYGYSPAFKIYGQTGQRIQFSVVSGTGAETVVASDIPYQGGAVTHQSFIYPTTAPPSPAANQTSPALNFTNQTQPSANQTSQTNQTQPSLNQTATTVNATGNASVSAQACWQCNDWGACRNNHQTRGCVRVDCNQPDLTGILTSEPATERSCQSTNVSSQQQLGPCMYNWECSQWSVCAASQQTRSCVRVDECNTAQTAGREIVAIPQPVEERSCQSGGFPGETQQAVCTPTTKRCLGQELQQCSFDGRSWRTLESCSGTCNPTTLQCQGQSTATPPETPRQPAAVWPYYLGGSVILGIVIIIILVLLHNQRRYQPVKEYIEENREKGFSDEQIKERLVDEGWAERKVEQLMK